MRLNFAVLRASGIVALAATAGWIGFVDHEPGAAGSPALHEQTFIDDRSGLAIAVQLDQAAADAGHVTFRVPGRGAYSAQARADMRVLTSTSVEIKYAGPSVLRTSGPSGGVSSTQITLQAHLDPAHHTAEATLVDGKDRFHLVAQNVGVGGLDPAVVAVERAITANDPAALYPLLNAKLARAVDASAFVASWNAQSAALGRITALRRTSTGSPQVTDQGFWFVAIEYSAEIAAPSGASSATFKAFFIHEPTGWKLWTTTRS